MGPTQAAEPEPDVQRRPFVSRHFSGLGIPIPKNAPRLTFEAIRKGDFAQACRYFIAGEKMFSQAPEVLTNFLNEISDNGRAVSYTVCAEFWINPHWYTVVETFADDAQTEHLQDQTWVFNPAGGGWVVTEVRHGKAEAPTE